MKMDNEVMKEYAITFGIAALAVVILVPTWEYAIKPKIEKKLAKKRAKSSSSK